VININLTIDEDSKLLIYKIDRLFIHKKPYESKTGAADLSCEAYKGMHETIREYLYSIHGHEWRRKAFIFRSLFRISSEV